MADDEMVLAKKILRNPMLFPDAFNKWIADYVAVNAKMDLKHVFGYKLETVKHDRIAAQATTFSTSYDDLDDQVGPQLTGLRDGTYLVLFGAVRPPQSAPELYASLSVNGSTPTDDEAVWWGTISSVGAGRAVVVDLRNDNDNSLVLKYRVISSANTNVHSRWIIAIKVVEHE